MSDFPSQPTFCVPCGTELAPTLLVCPACGRLVHGDELRELAEQAEQATQAQDPTAALRAWRRALELLPPSTRQHEVISVRMAALGRQVDEHSPARLVHGAESQGAGDKASWAKGAAGLGALTLLLWKFKFIAVFLLAKAKFLLLGLTKASTFFSMFVALGGYWLVWGWQFALGLVISIYVHEMGHVAALRRYGIHASAPMFIPFVGAVVRLGQKPANPREDARIGLAGPWWGLAAALVAYAVFLVTDGAIWAAIARVGAWINLFNLLPLWPLDGGRGFQSLTRSQRWLAAAAIGAMWFLTAEGLLVLLFLVGAANATGAKAAAEPDRVGLVQYVVLVVVLSAFCLIPDPLAPMP